MQRTFSRRAFVTGLAMLSVPLIAFAQDKKKDDKEREEKNKGHAVESRLDQGWSEAEYSSRLAAVAAAPNRSLEPPRDSSASRLCRSTA